MARARSKGLDVSNRLWRRRRKPSDSAPRSSCCHSANPRWYSKLFAKCLKPCPDTCMMTSSVHRRSRAHRTPLRSISQHCQHSEVITAHVLESRGQVCLSSHARASHQNKGGSAAQQQTAAERAEGEGSEAAGPVASRAQGSLGRGSMKHGMHRALSWRGSTRGKPGPHGGGHGA